MKKFKYENKKPHTQQQQQLLQRSMKDSALELSFFFPSQKKEARGKVGDGGGDIL